MAPLRPVVTLPQDPIAVAEITASAIRADARTGGAVPLSPDAVYHEDPTRGPNMLLSPAETSARGGGQCFDLVRAEGGYRGTHIGCCRTPIGFHVWLAFMGRDGQLMIYDISRLRGMPDEPIYEGAVYVPIWQPGEGGTPGPAGHEQPPEDLIGAAALPAATWADFVVTIGSPLITPGADLVLVRGAIDAALAGASDDRRREALGAMLAVLRALDEPAMKGAVRAELSGISADSMTPNAAKLIGALAVLSGRPWRSIVAQAEALPEPTYRRASPVYGGPMPKIIPTGSCPGSCAIPKRR